MDSNWHIFELGYNKYVSDPRIKTLMDIRVHTLPNILGFRKCYWYCSRLRVFMASSNLECYSQRYSIHCRTMLFPESVDGGRLWKCQDHPAGGRKEPCYPKSSHSVSVIIEAMGLLQKCWMFPLAARLVIGKLLWAFLTWCPDCIWIRLWLDQIAERETCVLTFVSPRCQQLNWTSGHMESQPVIIHRYI